jgi:hypothetical protein
MSPHTCPQADLNRIPVGDPCFDLKLWECPQGDLNRIPVGDPCFDLKLWECPQGDSNRIPVGDPCFDLKLWECPQGDSNPCFGLERAASWATRRWGRHSAGILPRPMLNVNDHPMGECPGLSPHPKIHPPPISQNACFQLFLCYNKHKCSCITPSWLLSRSLTTVYQLAFLHTTHAALATNYFPTVFEGCQLATISLCCPGHTLHLILDCGQIELIADS